MCPTLRNARGNRPKTRAYDVSELSSTSMATAIATDRVLPAFAPKAGLGDFFRAFALPFSSIGLLFRSSKLFLLSLLSAAVTFASLVALVWLLTNYTDDWVSALWTKPEAWYVVWLWYLFLALTFVMLLVIGANTVPLVLLAPLQDPLSEATEELCGDFTAPPFTLANFAKQAGVSIAHTVKRVSLLLGGHALLFPINFVPVAGSIVWTVLSTVWTMWWLAAEYVGAPMARHLYSFRDVYRALLSRKAAALGFGAALYLLLWVPVLNFFLIPAAVASGTLFFRGLCAVGHIGPPTRT